MMKYGWKMGSSSDRANTPYLFRHEQGTVVRFPVALNRHLFEGLRIHGHPLLSRDNQLAVIRLMR